MATLPGMGYPTPPWPPPPWPPPSPPPPPRNAADVAISIIIMIITVLVGAVGAVMADKDEAVVHGSVVTLERVAAMTGSTTSEGVSREP